METIDNKRKIGRPRKYYTKDEHDQAQRRYRKTWYENNKEYVRDSRNLDREREKRKLRTSSGYFAIYSGDDTYFGYSRDIQSRARDIIKHIERNDKNTTFYDKFDNTKKYDWKILAFAEKPNDEMLDGLVETETNNNPNINII
jgi:hypothetical protein